MRNQMHNKFAAFGWIALLAYLSSAAVGNAQTMSYADAVTVLANDCGADIKKLCKGLNLGGGAIQNCLQQNAGKVSPTCKSSLIAVWDSIQKRRAAQDSYAATCKWGMIQLCKGVRGDGKILSCLSNKARLQGSDCAQAITDAGWR